MTIIKATFCSYHKKGSVSFYFNTRKRKIKVSKLVDEISKSSFACPDFTKDLDYHKTVRLEELCHNIIEDSEGKYLVMFDLINTIAI